MRSRSLNHLDTLGQTYHQHQHQQVETVDGEGDIGSTVVLTADPTTTTTAAVVRDHCRSEPDCTMARAHQERLLTVPATDSPVPGTTDRTGSSGSDRIRTTTRRQMLSRSQVTLWLITFCIFNHLFSHSNIVRTYLSHDIRGTCTVHTLECCKLSIKGNIIETRPGR